MARCIIDFTQEQKRVYDFIISKVVKKYNIDNYKIKYFIHTYQKNNNKIKDVSKVYLYVNNSELINIHYYYFLTSYLCENFSKYNKNYGYYFELYLNDKDIEIMYNKIKQNLL